MKNNSRRVLAAINRGTKSPLAKTYALVNDPSTDSIVSWTESGKSFIIWKPHELSGDVLFTFMGYTLFSSFTRTLEYLGIRKVEGSEKLEYANEYFVRGKPELFNRIFERISVEYYVKIGRYTKEEAIADFRKYELKGLITIRPKEEELMCIKFYPNTYYKSTAKQL